MKKTFVKLTFVNGNKHRHHGHFSIVCDCLNIGMEKVKFVEKNQLQNNSMKLCVSAYEQYYDGVSLHDELVKWYQVDVLTI